MRFAPFHRATGRSPAASALAGRLTILAWLLALVTGSAGIPEPDLVWYGRVLNTSGGTPVRVVTGTLSWQIEPLAGGTPWTLSTRLTNINDQFSFLLRIPCETPEAGVAATTNTVLLTSPATAYRRVTVTLDGQALSLSGASGEFAPGPADRGRAEQVDLVLGSLAADTDGDGLPDAWEQQFFGDLGAGASDDSDGDGVNNLREFRAGTIPTDPQSRFEVVEIRALPTGIRVRWSSQPDHHYVVRRSTTLLAAPAAYQTIQTGIAATPPVNEFLDTTAGGGAQFFYLIQIEE